MIDFRIKQFSIGNDYSTSPAIAVVVDGGKEETDRVRIGTFVKRG